MGILFEVHFPYLDKFISSSNIEVYIASLDLLNKMHDTIFEVYGVYLDCGWEVIVSGYFLIRAWRRAEDFSKSLTRLSLSSDWMALRMAES